MDTINNISTQINQTLSGYLGDTISGVISNKYVLIGFMILVVVILICYISGKGMFRNNVTRDPTTLKEEMNSLIKKIVDAQK